MSHGLLSNMFKWQNVRRAGKSLLYKYWKMSELKIFGGSIINQTRKQKVPNKYGTYPLTQHVSWKPWPTTWWIGTYCRGQPSCGERRDRCTHGWQTWQPACMFLVTSLISFNLIFHQHWEVRRSILLWKRFAISYKRRSVYNLGWVVHASRGEPLIGEEDWLHGDAYGRQRHNSLWVSIPLCSYSVTGMNNMTTMITMM